MALKVSNTPSYTGTLKVVNNYPATTVKVVQNYGMQGSNYNPQPAGAYKPQPAQQVQSTYRPQTTANQQQINQARVQQEWARQQAEALRIEQERQAYEKLVRKNTFNSNTTAKSNDWKAKMAGAVGLGGVLSQWRSRNTAVKLGNDLNLSADEIEQAIRHFEREADKRKRAYEANPTEDNYNQLVAWATQQEKFFGDTIQNFTTANETLTKKANQPFTGRASAVGRGITKVANVVGTPAKLAWNAGFWAIDQPARLVNTAKNLINPNNLRQYYDGTELKGGKRDLRWAYNASRDQKIIGRGKEDEKAQMEWLQKVRDRKLANPGRNIFGGNTSSGFLRNNEFDRLRILYGDDVVNVLLDPANWIGAGTVAKAKTAVKGTRFGSTITGKLDDILKTTRKKFVPTLGKLGDTYRSPREKMFDLAETFKASKSALIAKQAGALEKARGVGHELEDFFDTLKTYKSGKKIGDKAKDEFKNFARSPYDNPGQDTELRHNFIKQLGAKSDEHKALFMRGVQNGFKMSPTDRVRYVGKGNKPIRIAVEKDLRQYKQIAESWRGADGIKANRFTRSDRGYLPYVTDGEYNPAMKRRYKGSGDVNDLEMALLNREMMSALPQEAGRMRSLWDSRNKLIRNKFKLAEDMKKGAIGIMGDTLSMSEVRGMTKKQAFDKMFAKVGNLKGQQKNLYRDARLASADKAEVAKNQERYKAILNGRLEKQHTKKEIFGFPNRVWKSLVTIGTPGWYLNNAVTNELVGLSAGGGRFLTEQLKHLNPLNKAKRLADKASLPKGVASDIQEGLNIGKLGRFGSMVENSARIPLFKAMKKQGLSDKEALQVVNNHLFDYKTKNWDRPVKSLLPFWLWSKNLTKLGATMAFNNPRGMNMFNYGNRKIENDYKNAPSDPTAYTDDSTGEVVNFDRKEKLKGKLKIGDKKWLDTNWLPFTPDRASQFGFNPYLAGLGEAMSGENKFGDVTTLLKTLTDRTSASRWIQASSQKPGVKKWFSEAGYGKEQQGSDPTKSNYNKWLDPSGAKTKARNSFFGLPSVTTYDPSVNNFRDTMASFNKEYFAIDWDTLKKEDYKGAMAKQEELAKKYGLTWSQVVADWSKYDTKTAQNTKALKDVAYSDQTKFWNDWYPLKRNDRNNVVRQYYKDQTAKRNPYTIYPVLKGDDKIKGTADDKLLSPATVKDSTAVQVGGKWFKSQASADRYWNAQAKRKNVVKAEGKYFKSADSYNRYMAGKEKKDFWTQYFALTDKKARKQLLLDNPKYNMFTDNQKSQAEWDLIKANYKLTKQQRMRKIAGFTQKEMNMKNFTVPPVRFTKSKKIAFKF